jgi:hypothetical protein
MRGFLLGLSLISAGSLKVCGSEGSGSQAVASADAVVSASASGSVALSPAQARIGGQVLVVGDHSVEVLLHQSGLVEAVVSDASGKLVSDGVGLSVIASNKAHARQDLALAFLPARARFEGQAKAGIELASGPLELSLSLNGKTAKASLAGAVAVKGPEFGGTVLTLGDHSAEVLLRTNGEILAFVRDAAGAAVDARAGLELNANVRVTGGASESVALHFDAARKCFAGHVKAGVELVPGSFELSLSGKAGAAVGHLEAVALRVEASHGGNVVVAGDYSVELVQQGREVAAFVFDASGKAVAAADLDLKLQLAGGPSLGLSWDAPSASYRGNLSAGLALDTSPITLALSAGGRAFVGAAASLHAIAETRLDPPRVDVDAKLGADAKLAAGAKAAAGAKLAVPDVKANLTAGANKAASAAAAVKVAAPKVSVQKSASANAKGGSAKASAGFSFGVK